MKLMAAHSCTLPLLAGHFATLKQPSTQHSQAPSTRHCIWSLLQIAMCNSGCGSKMQCNGRLGPACNPLWQAACCLSAQSESWQCPALPWLLKRTLLCRVNRTKTPWVIVGEHAPWYHSYTTHWCGPRTPVRPDCMAQIRAAVRCMLPQSCCWAVGCSPTSLGLLEIRE